ncbi:DinB family protein [Streptomyces oceani]|uniref:Mini-circle protein n=1 Tax=Streptomyces oceani TaxID=1075402 RepID=A0A1E7JXH1_9ACTN|nr:DinB family protein [Streptomyces oceani]OEU96352.1 hypothetical protein AN216_21070 [Streptomyces oceani]
MTTMPDGRPIPPPHAEERHVLEGWLDFHRETLALKCAGLDDAQAREAAVPPSTMTLLGLVQHLTEVERKWCQRVFAGRQELPPAYGTAGEDGFALSPEVGMADALAAWRAEVAASRDATSTADSLDAPGTLTGTDAQALGSSVSLRWILTHLIEEYARHNGHADLLRERVDGTTGS